MKRNSSKAARKARKDKVMRFVCPEHGEVNSERVSYSCPATGWCPKCGKMLTDQDGGVRVMSSDEAKKVRPGCPPNSGLDCTKETEGEE